MAYNPVIPEIAQAFQNDPRTKLAQQMMATGSSTAPVSGGKWAWADGIARALQGVAGGYVQHKQQKKYRREEESYQKLIAEALGGRTDGSGPKDGLLPGDGVMAQAPTAPLPGMMPLVPPQAPIGPNAMGDMAPPTMPPQAPPAQAPAPGPVQPPVAAAPPMPAPQQRPAAPVRAAPPRQALPPAEAVWNSIVQQESGGRPGIPGQPTKYGRAMGMTQLLPATAREMAGKLNIPYRPELLSSKTPEGAEYQMRLGRAYFEQGLRETGGDLRQAAMYYHGGPDRSIWGPKTRRYASAVLARAGASGGAAAPTAQAASTPLEPVQQVTTPEPALPDIPNAPAPIPAVRSQRADAGRRLLMSGNRYATAQGSRMLEAGMGENFQADENAANRQFETGQTGYRAGLDDAYGARTAQRQGAYQARSDERNAGFRQTEQNRGFQHDDVTREDNQAQETARDAYGRETQYALQEKQEAGADRRNAATIEGRVQTEQEKRITRQSNFINTPAGTRLANEVENSIKANDAIINDLHTFQQLNQETSTGGVPMMGADTGINPLANARIAGSGNLQRMRSIINRIAPTLRQVGSGPFTDKDYAYAVQSLPNLSNTSAANKSISDRLIRTMERINDYNQVRLEYAANGKRIEFLRDFNKFKNSVPVASGVTFGEWRDRQRLDANGRPVQ